jgi:hypothetical protein
MKKCFKCGISQPLSSFYKHPQMADGHLNKCKSCTKSDVHKHRHGKGRAKVLAYDLERAKTPERIANRAKVVSKWSEDHKIWRAAQSALSHAVKSGKVQKWPCCAVADCNSEKVVAHHPDYSRPLDVVWLCQAHHKQTHALTDSQRVNTG